MPSFTHAAAVVGQNGVRAVDSVTSLITCLQTFSLLLWYQFTNKYIYSTVVSADRTFAFRK